MSEVMVPPQLKDVLAKNGVDVRNVIEAHAQPFYSYKTYATAGTAAPFNFFQDIKGTVGGGVTNMPDAGKFPKPKRFLWTATGVFFHSGAAVTGVTSGKSQLDDYDKIMNASAFANVTITDKEYFRCAPLAMAPVDFGVGGDLAIADAAQNVGAVARGIGTLRRHAPLLIDSNTAFVGTVQFDAATATPSTVDGRIGMILYGILYQTAA